MIFASGLQSAAMANDLRQIRHRLGERGHFWTRARSAVLRPLTAHASPLTAEEIHRPIRGSGVNLSSVYRALHLFQSLRIVRRLELGQNVGPYELADGSREHHHHLVCDACGRIEDMTACPVDQARLGRRIRKRTGFAVRSHLLELFGLCPACQRGGR
jgi:Fur family ferric uptake transcriptional regulator